MLKGSEIGPVGLELEMFAANDGRPVDVLRVAPLLTQSFNGYGRATSDAGLGHLEIITPPCITGKVALGNIKRMYDLIPCEWDLILQARRPENFPGSGEWATMPRFTAMMSALAREMPETWSAVKAVAEWSALHVNLGVDPRRPEGLGIMNIMNNVGPYVGSQVRGDHPESKGHLAIWSGWADPRRLPCFCDWYMSWNEFEQFFSTVPKLIRGGDKKDGRFWEVDLENPQMLPASPDSEHIGDLGTWWKLFRPKLGEAGWYLEGRVLPSMPLASVDRFTIELLDGIAALLDWFYANGSPVLRSPEEARPALRHASDRSPLFPKEPLDEQSWDKYFVM